MSSNSTIIRLHAEDKNTGFNPNESLMTKWKKSYENNRRRSVIVSKYYSFTYFFCICSAELYCAFKEIIPYFYSQFGWEYVYLMKVISMFVFVNTIANWTLTILTKTHVLKDNDRPDSVNLAWQKYEKTSDKAGEQIINLGSVDRSDLHWAFCKTCEVPAPPRSHHCPICEHCILKRDHHCFLVGTCIGFYNQRFFVILTFYVAVASFIGLAHIVIYMKDTFYPFHSFIDWFFPVTLIRFVMGDVSLTHALLMLQIYTFWWSGPVCLGFFLYQLIAIYYGKTAYELAKSQGPHRIRSLNSISYNFQSVFGSFWGINFLFPAHPIFKQMGDGRNWPGVKIKYDV